jgi:protein-tyrosine phosphatase
VINFIEEVKQQGGRVLIHCMQGVSRSVSLIICYLIYTRKLNFDEALNYVIDKRAIAGPNFGFGIQLQYFFKRLYEPPENFRVYPKIFAVASYQAEQLDKIVCRLVYETVKLDDR